MSLQYDDKTAAMLASKQGMEGCLRLLIAAGANLEIECKEYRVRECKFIIREFVGMKRVSVR